MLQAKPVTNTTKSRTPSIIVIFSLNFILIFNHALILLVNQLAFLNNLSSSYKDETNWIPIGILFFPDGSTYEGEWANGFMNGEGTFTWSDGKQKKGIWKNGSFQE